MSRAFSTSARQLKKLKWAFNGTTVDVSWVQRTAENAVDEASGLANKIDSGVVQGNPHPTRKTGDPYHASITLGINDIKGKDRVVSAQGYSKDMNGAWDIVESAGLFRQVHDAQGRYDTKAHLAEMIALLGPPPRELLAKSDAMAQQKWPNPVENEAGKVCRNARDYFGGPFFNEGKFIHDALIPARKLEATIPSLDEKDRQIFLSFVGDMLTWLPEKRKTARELMEHPFFK